MSLADLSGGKIAIGLVAVLSLIQIAPIKINPWSWIFGLIGKLMNADLITETKALADEVSALKAKMGEASAQNARYRIIRFDDELLVGTRHSKEHFDEILTEIDIYERYCQEHPNFPNNKAVLAITHIKRVYQNCVDKQSFL